MVNFINYVLILFLICVLIVIVKYNWKSLTTDYKEEKTTCEKKQIKKLEGKIEKSEKTTKNNGSDSVIEQTSNIIGNNLQKASNNSQKQTCPRFDTNKTGCYSDKYILKTSIKPCSPNPPMTKFIKEKKCPKCPTCPNSQQYGNNKLNDYDWVPVQMTEELKCDK
jgi:hypothetical protein